MQTLNKYAIALDVLKEAARAEAVGATDGFGADMALEICQYFGTSHQEFADMVGCNRTVVSRWFSPKGARHEPRKIFRRIIWIMYQSILANEKTEAASVART